MTSEPLRNAGPSSGQVVKNLGGLLDEYYEALGYKKNGIPTAEKLEELGIEQVIKDN
jgi:aldehyde:ferredoxin oxidoreductase